ncbi:MAG TPA: ABC transporter permease [Bryobacteraceae bacterium]|nr:ABC transporter permease [Bryobacteraceae bacterium]
MSTSFNLLQDVRYALRMLTKNPGFTIVAALTLALGIGANTAIFTVANTLLLRPLPYADPDRLMLVSMSSADSRGQLGQMSYGRFLALNGQNRSFSGTAAFANESFNLSGQGDPEQLLGARVSWNFFDVLGVRPALGRSFEAKEDQPGGGQVVLISHALWLRLFGGRHDAVGRSLSLDSKDYTVIGVLPVNFVFPLAGTNVDVWASRFTELNILTPRQLYGGASFLTVLGRLAPGTSREQAQAEITVLDRQYRHDNPGRPDSDPRQSMIVQDLKGQIVANIRTALLILMGAVGFVLLIACANVASLLLSRALGRKKEIAVRAALGASRRVLIWQLLTESLLLALAGGVLGILLSLWGTHVLASLTTNTLPRMAEVDIDLRVLGFTVIVSLASGILFGLAPALQLSKPDLNTMLRDEGRGSTGTRRRNNARNLLVVAQVALSMVLLVGSGLLIRSFIRLATVSPGFDPKNAFTMRIALPASKYTTKTQIVGFYQHALESVRTLPGVEAAAISSAIPLNPSRMSPMLPEGQPAVPIGQRPILYVQTISPDYNKVLRIPLLRGRMFNEHDDADAPPVAIVNQATVRRYWPNEDPIGKHILMGQIVKPVEVVGVFGDIKNVSLAAEANPEVLVPFPQLPWLWLNLDVRTAGNPRDLISAVRQRIAQVDKDQPLTNVQTMEELLESGSSQPRFTMFLLGIFSAVALILAIVGIYGVIAYSVAQRTQELGIRMALGAAKGDILKLVLGHGLGLSLAGIAIGVGGSLALTRLMSTLLYQTSATDPLAFTISAGLFAAVALAASYVPARRATRIDPTGALRGE